MDESPEVKRLLVRGARAIVRFAAEGATCGEAEHMAAVQAVHQGTLPGGAEVPAEWFESLQTMALSRIPAGDTRAELRDFAESISNQQGPRQGARLLLVVLRAIREGRSHVESKKTRAGGE